MTIALENWRWHGAIGPAEAAGFVLSEANCIKRNPVRRVYLTGDCYVKIEFPAGRLRRLGACWRPKAAAEYGAARRLAAAGMPVVEYLGWGQRGGLNAVVSRRWPDGEDVHSYFYRELVYGAEKAPEFYAALLDFLGRYRHCGVNHPDFHLGNVLYRPDDRQFTLVDVYRVGLGGREGVRRRQLGHFLLELRAAQPLEQLLDWGAQLGLSASLLRQELADARAALRRELPRRLRQLLEGYPKFSAWSSDGERRVLLIKDMLRRLPVPAQLAGPEKTAPERIEKLLADELFARLDGRSETGMIAAWEPPDLVYRRQRPL